MKQGDCISLGPETSYSLLNDPKHLCFVLARYKFCSKILEGKQNILEIGCGDAFGTPIVAQNSNIVVAIDIDGEIIDSNRKLLKTNNVSFVQHDICDSCIYCGDYKFDGAFAIDVIEHINPLLENDFMENSIRCLRDDGVYIIGTPNITASPFATEKSRTRHINLKGHQELRDLMSKYFNNVFLFSMNDEVVHTGFYPMAHYLFGVGIGVKHA